MSTATDQIIEQLKNISLFEAKELVTQIEQTFGVDASVSVGGGAASAAPGVAISAAEQVEEKTTFDVILEDIASDKRVSVLKVLRVCTSLGLKEAKEFTNSLPKVVKGGISKEEAETTKKQLEDAGGTVKIA